MLDIHYEKLVEEQERVTRALINYCGLSWDDRCLRPQETDREIRSASYWQVRQPVYQGSVSKWRCYESHLAPLIDSLQSYGYVSDRT